MPVRVENQKYKTIRSCDMRDGQIGEILWDDSPSRGVIVQRKGDALIAIGEPSGDSYSSGATTNMCVRILPNGTHLIIEGNE